MSSLLFSPLKIRDVVFRNRVFVSPMCQYSAKDGLPNAWHLVHLGSRAVGGAGLVMVEASAVCPDGRISDGDTGIWNDDQKEAFKPIVQFLKSHGSVPGIQLAHAGRKAATEGQAIAPSAVAFSAKYSVPKAMTESDMDQLVAQFARAVERSRDAGFELIEIHMAHGYLLHEFLSPLSNQRTDHYGGSLENRMRLPLRVAQSVRELWPKTLPVFVRISASDWVANAWDLEQSLIFARELKMKDIDLIDCSSGGSSPDAQIPEGPAYQVPFAAAIRKETGVRTGAVGKITDAVQAEEILRSGKADVIFIGRESLRHPYWPLHAARTLGADSVWPRQYLRAPITE